MTATSSGCCSLDDLPTALLGHVIEYVGNPQAFRALEKSCRTFRELFQDDRIWKFAMLLHQHNPSEEVDSHHQREEGPVCSSCCFRDEAFRPVMIQRIEHWQGRADGNDDGTAASRSILKRVFLRYDGQLKSYLFDQVRRHVNRTYHNGQDLERFILRGDTAGILMEILESYLIRHLQSAFKIAIHRTPSSSIYPSVAAKDFRLVDKLRQELTGNLDCFVDPPVPPMFDDYYEEMSPEIQAEVNTIVRRLAYRAGIAKMENDMYSAVWGTIENLAKLLTWTGCIELANSKPDGNMSPIPQTDDNASAFLPTDQTEETEIIRPRGWLFVPRPKRWLDHGETMRDYAPFPEWDDRAGKWQNILIPRHVQIAAQRLGIPSTVHRFEWLQLENEPRSSRAYAIQMYHGPGTEIAYDDDDDIQNAPHSLEESYEYREDEDDASEVS